MTHKIKTLLIFSACAAVLSMYTAAAETCAAAISTYGDTLQDFISNDVTCTYGGFTFSDFSYVNNAASGTGTLVTSSDITVATYTSPMGSNGLDFDLTDMNSGFNGASDGTIEFEVTANNGGTEIEDAGLTQISSATGTGLASVAEQGCGPAPCDPGTWATNTFEAGPGNGLNATTCAANGGTWNASNSICDLGSNDVILTNATGSVEVAKDINVTSGGSGTGSASISSVADTFSVVPEPRALSFLLGFGILAGLVLRRKFQSVKA